MLALSVRQQRVSSSFQISPSDDVLDPEHGKPKHDEGNDRAGDVGVSLRRPCIRHKGRRAQHHGPFNAVQALLRRRRASVLLLEAAQPAVGELAAQHGADDAAQAEGQKHEADEQWGVVVRRAREGTGGSVGERVLGAEGELREREAERGTSDLCASLEHLVRALLLTPE